MQGICVALDRKTSVLSKLRLEKAIVAQTDLEVTDQLDERCLHIIITRHDQASLEKTALYLSKFLEQRQFDRREIPIRILFERSRKRVANLTAKHIEEQLVSKVGCFCAEINQTSLSIKLVVQEIVEILGFYEEVMEPRTPDRAGTFTKLIWGRNSHVSKT